MDIFLILVALLPAVVSIDPCVQNTMINEKMRSEDNVIRDIGYESMLCDRSIPLGWYRFTQGPTNSMPATLATRCIEPYHCGTHVPLWMNGTHPTPADGIVTRQICGKFMRDCCSLKDTTRVKNCGTFYVYELKPTKGCSLAYCAGTGVPCPPNQSSATGYQPGCKDGGSGSVITG